MHPSIHVTTAANADNHAERYECRQYGRPAIAQERQRDARCGNESNDHSDIHDEMEEISSDDPHHNEQPEVIPRRLRVVNRAEDDKRKQPERPNYTDETEF